MSIKKYLEASGEAIQDAAADDGLLHAVDEACRLVIEALSQGLPILVCGNGGSACDALHLTAELVGRFLRERKALNVIALSGNAGVLTAIGNDYSYDYLFARQVEAYGKPGAILIGLSTSGNSVNIVRAFEAGRAQGMKIIAFTKEGSTKIAPLSDVLIAVPCASTPLIQQVHMCLYHYLCHAIEQEMLQEETVKTPQVLSGALSGGRFSL